MNLRQMQEARATLQAKNEAAQAEMFAKGEWSSDEEKKRFEDRSIEIRKLDLDIDRQKLIDEADRRAGGQPIDREGDAQAIERRRNYRKHSLARHLAIDAGLIREDGLEAENRAELKRQNPNLKSPAPLEAFSIERRGVLTTTTPAGGPGSNLIGDDYRGSQYVDLLEAYNPLTDLGVRRDQVNGGSVIYPGGKTPAVAAFTGENSTIGVTDPEFRQVIGSPKHCTAIAEFSRNLLMSATPTAEELIRRLLSKAAAQKVAQVALQGGGANEPTGILATAGLPTVSLATPSYSAILDMESTLAESNAQGTGWAMRPLVATRLRKTPKVASTDSVMIMEAKDELIGYPVARTTLLAIDTVPTPDETPVIFGDWSDMILAEWGAIDLLSNPFAAGCYEKGNVSIRMIWTVDVLIRHIESFVAATDFPAA